MVLGFIHLVQKFAQISTLFEKYRTNKLPGLVAFDSTRLGNELGLFYSCEPTQGNWLQNAAELIVSS